MQLQLDSSPAEPEFPPNGTETSIDDPFTQLCDQDPSLIVCGESRSLEILTRVLKTDSSGTQTTVETVTDLPFASLFVEDTSNIDFRTGQLQFEVFIKGDPTFRYSGSGSVNILIGNEPVFTEPINVEVDGVADEEGIVDLLFLSPTGIPSDLILFDFEENFDKFADEQTTPVRLHFIELNIAGERDQEFALLDTDVFTMDIFRDEIQILITDEQGIESRVYPSDSVIRVNSVTNESEPANTGTVRIRVWDSIFYGNGRGCSVFNIISDTSFTPSTPTTTTVPAPTLTGITIMDEQDSVVDTRASGGTYQFSELTRNQNYTISMTSPNIISDQLEYGKSQETKTFSCKQEGTANTRSHTVISGNTNICGYYTETTYITLNTDNPVTITPNSITCNIPTGSP